MSSINDPMGKAYMLNVLLYNIPILILLILSFTFSHNNITYQLLWLNIELFILANISIILLIIDWKKKIKVVKLQEPKKFNRSKGKKK